MVSFPINVEMDVMGSLRLVRECIVGVWMAPQTPMVSIISGFTGHLSLRSLSNIGVYFCSVCVMDSFGSLPRQKENSMSCICRLGVGRKGKRGGGGCIHGGSKNTYHVTSQSSETCRE